jgi:hypothetical protein
MSRVRMEEGQAEAMHDKEVVSVSQSVSQSVRIVVLAKQEELTGSFDNGY